MKASLLCSDTTQLLGLEIRHTYLPLRCLLQLFWRWAIHTIHRICITKLLQSWCIKLQIVTMKANSSLLRYYVNIRVRDMPYLPPFNVIIADILSVNDIYHLLQLYRKTTPKLVHREVAINYYYRLHPIVHRNK